MLRLGKKLKKTNNYKKILILGASSDIGIEIVRKFLNNNWEVYGHYFSNNKPFKKIKNSKFKSIKINFLDKQNNISKKLKILKNIKFDAFINLAGFIDNKTFENFNIEDMLKAFKVNTVVPLYILKFIIRSMIVRKFGRILLTSSIGVKFGGGKNTFNYSISKKANEFIPRNYKDWAKNNVLINSLIIGVTNTKIHKKISKKNINKRTKLIPINRLAEPKEISEYVSFLLSEKNTYITGQILSISGGE
tara:strand:- start:1972 stop:2715 length:744 start_codon:yes stop_codon:yes gene_type:complete